VFSGGIIAEYDGLRDKRSGDTTTVEIQALLENFYEYVPEISLFQS